MATSAVVHYEGPASTASPPPESSVNHPLLSHHLLMKNEHLHHHHQQQQHRLYQPYNHLPVESYGDQHLYPIASTSAAVAEDSRCSSASSSGDQHQLTLKSESSSVDNNMELLDSANVCVFTH